MKEKAAAAHRVAKATEVSRLYRFMRNAITSRNIRKLS